MYDYAHSENSSDTSSNSNNFDVIAGGLILYRIRDSIMELLLIEKNGQYEDFGGNTDLMDTDIYDTISRQFNIQSNNLFSKSKMKKRLLKTKNYVYMKKSKYIIFLIQTKKLEDNLTSDDLAKFGFTSNSTVKQTVRWVSIETFLHYDVLKYKINFRLKSKYLFDLIKQINNNAKPKKCLFGINASKN